MGCLRTQTEEKVQADRSRRQSFALRHMRFKNDACVLAYVSHGVRTQGAVKGFEKVGSVGISVTHLKCKGDSISSS